MFPGRDRRHWGTWRTVSRIRIMRKIRRSKLWAWYRVLISKLPLIHFTLIELLMTKYNASPSINRGRLFAACLLIFTNGINDAAPGALIPHMEKYYNISYAIVSLIFLSNAAGFIFAAFVSQPLYSRIGRSKTILVGITLLGIASLTTAFAPPWGVIVASYFLTGAGMALVWTFFYIRRAGGCT